MERRGADSFDIVLPAPEVVEGALFELLVPVLDLLVPEVALLVPDAFLVVSDEALPGTNGGSWFVEVAFCAIAMPMAPALAIVITADAKNFLVNILIFLN